MSYKVTKVRKIYRQTQTLSIDGSYLCVRNRQDPNTSYVNCSYKVISSNIILFISKT